MNRRRKPCDFCNNGRIVVTNNDKSIRMEMDPDEGTLTIRQHVGGAPLIRTPFHFCPMCGRRVTEVKL